MGKYRIWRNSLETVSQNDRQQISLAWPQSNSVLKKVPPFAAINLKLFRYKKGPYRSSYACRGFLDQSKKNQNLFHRYKILSVYTTCIALFLFLDANLWGSHSGPHIWEGGEEDIIYVSVNHQKQPYVLLDLKNKCVFFLFFFIFQKNGLHLTSFQYISIWF